MHFGLFAINNGVCADPDACLPVAQLCESKGFESVWTGEHVVIPDPQVAPSPLSLTMPMLDPAVALAYIAGHTTTLKLHRNHHAPAHPFGFGQRNGFTRRAHAADSHGRSARCRGSCGLCALGVHRLISLPDGRFTRDELLRFVDETATLIST